MDVSSSVLDDPKFRRLARESPELVAGGFTAYMATMAESWRVGRRASVDEAWPAVLPFDQAVADALVRVGLLDRRAYIPAKAWRNWFEPARERREAQRERWARANAKRANPDQVTAPLPRGDSADTAPPSVPSVPSVPSDRLDEENNEPGDPLASKLAHSRPGSPARRRETDDLLRADLDARTAVDESRAAR